MCDSDRMVELGYLVAKAEDKARCELEVNTGSDGTLIQVRFMGGNGYTMQGGLDTVIRKLRDFLGKDAA